MPGTIRERTECTHPRVEANHEVHDNGEQEPFQHADGQLAEGEGDALSVGRAEIAVAVLEEDPGGARGQGDSMQTGGEERVKANGEDAL